MSRGERATARKTTALSGIARYVKLEQRLVLLAWLNSRFGYRSNRELLEDMKRVGEGFDAFGRSGIYHRMENRGSEVRVALSDLDRYDDNIRGHLSAINSSRPEPVTLRYFQYLAVLYAEFFLDCYFNHRGEMLLSLNRFVEVRNASKLPTDPPDPTFSESDLTKLAFWMATGSGKTLIMHLNYHQFLHYNSSPLDNILLITANEGLSDQHIEEMVASGIPCRRFDVGETDLLTSAGSVVRVIDIWKLVEEKRGGGVTVPVERFEGNNLVFVDEGHKGSGGEVWRSYRESLGETGFTFEYSATFGQALTAARNDQLTAEYGKAIAFDYSYRYFHEDGYGKDFRVLNLAEETTQENTDMLLLGNLLSFYEKLRVYEDRFDALRSYRLERPLWVFVGGTVNAVYSESGERKSDVLTVVRFLHRVLQNKSGWVVEGIKEVTSGKTGLRTPDGRDIFEDGLEYLRKSDMSPEEMYTDILAHVFHAPAGGGLHLASIRGGSDEIGLKASGAEDYFGLIYVGDSGRFRKLVDEDDSDIVLEEDVISGSLFSGIGDPDTSIEVLVGAKRFMEGWNSWRVSNMGLLNVGRREGSQIIQLFGRGVRLRGRDFSLKRSRALEGEHPENMNLLETLDIFAVRANYMSQFREYLENEGVETEGELVLSLRIKPNDEFLGKGLIVPRLPEGTGFRAQTGFRLEPDPAVRVQVDMSLKIQALSSGADGLTALPAVAGRKTPIPSASLELVDWERVYLELLDYKEHRGFANLVITPDAPRAIVSATEPARLYDLIADDSVIAPRSFGDRALLHDAVMSIVKRYTEKFYQLRREEWDSERMSYVELVREDANFQPYAIRISRAETQLIASVGDMIEEGERIYREDTQRPPAIHFDRHLYQPLLVERDDRIRTTPPGLKESELLFVDDLREYCHSERGESLAGREIFLLRNLSHGKGISFFEGRRFSPDFILWIRDDSSQRIVFVEPHGMRHARSYIHDDKAQLHESLSELTRKLRARNAKWNVTLDSYLISVTPYEDLRLSYGEGDWDRKRFAQAHILFFERDAEYDYLRVILA